MLLGEFLATKWGITPNRWTKLAALTRTTLPDMSRCRVGSVRALNLKLSFGGPARVRLIVSWWQPKWQCPSDLLLLGGRLAAGNSTATMRVCACACACACVRACVRVRVRVRVRVPARARVRLRVRVPARLRVRQPSG